MDEEITVSLYGEVQKEVLAARLATEFGIAADFLPDPDGVRRTGGRRRRGRRAGRRPATRSSGCGSSPARSGSGLATGSAGVERGYILPSITSPSRRPCRRALEEGLQGWRVVDCSVSLVHARFCAPTPPAGYFRDLTMSVLREALRQAGTVLCAPVSEFETEVPESAISASCRSCTRTEPHPRLRS